MTTPQTHSQRFTIVHFVLALCLTGALTGCHSAVHQHGRCSVLHPDQNAQDRAAILGMAGTYHVSFAFEESLALRAGYELHKPYTTQAEELVVVVVDDPTLISLQHLLVVRHEGETHVINHWRQDWRYEACSGYGFVGDNTWAPIAFDDQDHCGAWVQSVYNVADSPRYASIGRWTHRDGVSSWTGSPINRPIPLRENHLRDTYTFLASVNTHVVTHAGWVHYQHNHKLDSKHEDEPVLALEFGVNRYTRIPDEGFEDAHDYWKNTKPFWTQVRAVWAGVFAQQQPITLAKRWKGETLYAHLFGLADDYWGETDASAARPQIEAIIQGFLHRE